MFRTNPLIGKEVFINWKDEKNDWHWFLIKDFQDRLIKLRGLDDPDGNKHDKFEFWCPIGDIKELYEKDDNLYLWSKVWKDDPTYFPSY